MAKARFSIGIDLGTTSSALAFVPLHGEVQSEVFPVLQWESISGLAEALTLPSFLYLPEEAVAARIQGKDAHGGAWIVGQFARKRASESPERVARSAKSWLCHHAADRSAKFLPWGSTAIAHDSKISPIQASALILNYLRSAWNNRFADSGADFHFDHQQITITVPASFDAVAQKLTLTAAKEAGFPDTVRLLEEPQAAFYRWLEQYDASEGLWHKLPKHGQDSHHILVVDVGGGTSDFSLFELRRKDDSSLPAIKRVAVSDHILLGGDNVDMAIAHLLEPRLGNGDNKLSSIQWEYLVARCRDLKEKALSSEGPPEEILSISIPGRGASLIASMLSGQLSRAELFTLLLEGFFPACTKEEVPNQTHVSLKEWGLPYATDSAITRHLAGFLKDCPRVDAVLFNGGSLAPHTLRQRVTRLLSKWQDGLEPLILENNELHLAVARGAAHFGKILHCKADRIEAGSARAVFMEVHESSPGIGEKKGHTSLICILPRGSSPEETFAITSLPLKLRINQPVRFQSYYSTRTNSSKAGHRVQKHEQAFHALPPLETIIKTADLPGATANQTIPITLTAKLNELGLLKVSCVYSAANIERSWPLEFNLRPHEQSSHDTLKAAGRIDEALIQAEPNVAASALITAQNRITSLFTQPLNLKDKLTAARLFKNLEQIFNLPKSEWNWVVIRALWPTLENNAVSCKQSIEHEETWLILAGFLLRPGFGTAMDTMRMDSLWTLRSRGLYFSSMRVKLQEYILWRRLAGGLGRERQEKILTPELNNIHQKKNVPPELIQLTGSLERIGHDTKTLLIKHFIDKAVELIQTKKHSTPYLTALGLLLNRTPLYAGPETVVSPDLVEQAFAAFAPFHWAEPELAELQTLFLRAARVIDNRSLDLPSPLRNRIVSKLEKAGVTPLKIARLKKFVLVERSEPISLYGESLPPGLVLS